MSAVWNHRATGYEPHYGKNAKAPLYFRDTNMRFAGANKDRSKAQWTDFFVGQPSEEHDSNPPVWIAYQDMQLTFCLMVIDPDQERVKKTGNAKNWLSNVHGYQGDMLPYLDTEAMPVLTLFRRSLD